MSAVISVATIVLISAYLLMLLQLPTALWRGFGEIVAGLFVILFSITMTVNHRFLAPILAYLKDEEQGKGADETLRCAFEALARFPLRMFFSGIVWWSLGGVLVASAMWLRFDSFQALPWAVMSLAAASGGFVTSIFMYFVFKSHLGELLRTLASRLDGPEIRARLVHPVSLRSKLFVSVTGVTFVTVTFAMFLAFATSSRRLEANATLSHARYLEEVAPTLEAGGPDALSAASAQARRLGIAADLLWVDVAEGRVVAGPSELLYPSELAQITSADGAANRQGGNSLGFDSPNSFAWRPLWDGTSVVVAVTPWSEVTGETRSLEVVFLIMLAVSAAISFGLSRVLAVDVGSATRELQEKVQRMAAGDLRPGRVFESEDELGELARSFESMVTALRETVGRVAEAADQVERNTVGIESASENVARGAAEQGRGVEQAARLLERINDQVAGIAASARELGSLVEESSSSILEMGAAGEELNDTAGVLSSRVDEVSTSIEEMVRSVKEVVANSEALSAAATETSSSMEQMASAMRQVDNTAEETAALSERMVVNAETGQARVRQTIEGMQSIREATDTAERVIRVLGTRAVEIGAILDVIDDVADETSLLALNAAIIAAQAGEHGRAFSVVANEIKELADRVLASTKEIGGLIRSLQEESENAVGAIEVGSRSVASGVQLSREAGASLEEITRASRESGTRMHEILQAVREQTKAAVHVVGLMESVNAGVEAIQRAAAEQDRGNEVVYLSSEAMREVAQQLRGTTQEQARGGARIRESIEGVRDATLQINGALEAQSASYRELKGFLDQVSERTSANEQSVATMKEAKNDLQEQSEALRDEVRRFTL
ncbi:MAG: methyl-accepting chemotaxis protein [Proteobacteria bacterium]|nr:methyl-accepting chemotaxis protein [Pseudomonadota bacterium]